MALELPVDLSIASATLSGGARSVASGGGYPARLTTQDDSYYSPTSLGSAAAGKGGIAFDPDNLHFWILVGTTAGASTGLRKINIASGSVVTTITGNGTDGGTRAIVSPQGLTRRGNELSFASSGTGNYLCKYNMVTGIMRMYSQATVAAPYHVVFDGTCLWARTSSTSSGTYQEFTLAGTGDSAAATATANTVASAWEMFVDVAGTNAYFLLSASVTKYTLATHVVASTYTPATVYNFPGYTGNALRGGFYDHLEDKVVVRQTNSDNWWYINSAFTGSEKRFMGMFEHGGAVAEGSATSIPRSCVALSDDGTKVGFITPEGGVSAALPTAVKIRNIGVERARWTYTVTAAGQLKTIFVPGDLANVNGVISNLPSPATWFGSATDFRKTKVFYSLNGGARTEYKGETLSLALAVSDSLVIDVDMQHLVTHPHAFAPFVGGVNGEGVRLSILPTNTPRRGRIQGGI